MRAKHLTGTVALTLAATAAARGATVYDAAGFEPTRFATGNLTNQDGGTWIESGAAAGGSASVTTGAALNGSQGIQVTRIASAANGGDKRYWPNTPALTPTAASPVVTVAWDMNVAANASPSVTTGPFFGIESYTPAAALIAAAGVDATTGEVLFEDPANGGAFNNTTADDTVTLNAWHHYVLAMDFTAGSATVTVDGALKQSIPSFLSAGATQFSDADLSALATAAEPANQTGLARFDNYSVTVGVAGPQPVVVAAGQTYHFPATSAAHVSTVPGLTVNATGIAYVDSSTSAANRQLLVVNGIGLTLAGSAGNWTGKLDVGNNDLDLPNASLATVTDQVRQGFNGGTWSAAGGITSSAAAADANHLTALGVIANGAAGLVAYTSFDGQPVSAGDVLVRYTYYGDTNLDGSVNAADYTRIDAGAVNSLTGWANGDFNYDGVVDGSDYALMDNAYDQQANGVGAPAAVVATGVAAVPEPASLALVVLGGLVLRRSARRR